jgi:hypothetical protein
MSEQGTIYGCIFAGLPLGRPVPDYIRALEINQAAIQALPDKVDWDKGIYLTRDTFCVPMAESTIDNNYHPKTPFYRLQMIHFGASFNHLDLYWGDWLEQFEILLRQMFWFEAYVHMTAEIFYGEGPYHWKADIKPMFESPARPIEQWQFTGGPRKFDYH